MARSMSSRVYVAALSVMLVGTGIALIRRLTADEGNTLPPDVGVVEHVVDGDTIELAIGGRTERVRLIGIDTPELAHDDGARAECFGPEAQEFTRSLLPDGTEVRLERDVVGRDDYDRVLAYVYRRHDDAFVNLAVIAEGYAVPLSIAPNEAHRGEFVAAARDAEAAGLGLWAACPG